MDGLYLENPKSSMDDLGGTISHHLRKTPSHWMMRRMTSSFVLPSDLLHRGMDLQRSWRNVTFTSVLAVKKIEKTFHPRGIHTVLPKIS